MTVDPHTTAPLHDSGEVRELPGLRQPLMRASDADRERVAHQLRQHLADGRLTVDEFTERIDEAYTARTLDELAHTQRELPYIRSPEPDEMVGIRSRADPDRTVLGRYLTVSVLFTAFLVVVWLLHGIVRGELGYFWPILGWACHLVILLRAVAARATPWRGRRAVGALRSRSPDEA